MLWWNDDIISLGPSLEGPRLSLEKSNSARQH